MPVPIVAGPLASSTSGTRAEPAATARTSSRTPGRCTTTAAKSAATRSGHPRKSAHHSPRPAVSTQRSKPTPSSTSQDAPASAPSPYAANGTRLRRSTNAPASRGIAIVVPIAGFAASHAFVEQSASPPITATPWTP